MQKPGLFRMNGVMALMLTCLYAAAGAQPPGYLILIDAENKQPFTVRVGDQLFSSSTHGHLVLTQLKDSAYKLNVRFSRMGNTESVFPVKVHRKDLGFQIKGGDTTWVLYNWQTKETIRSIYERDSSRILDQGIKREDGFSRLMAAVVNDSSVMYNTYSGELFRKDSFQAKSIKPKVKNVKDSISLAKKAKVAVDSVSTAKLPASIVAPAGNPPPTTSSQPAFAEASAGKPPVASRVKKLREVSLKISRKMVFLDYGGDGGVDTITLFVYFETADLANQKTAVPVPEIKKSLKPDSAETSTLSGKNKIEPKLNPSCGQLASDGDQEAVRSEILKSNTENEKIALASGAFALKCFYVSQIRILAGLFVSDKARYKLMDAAHLHIADPENFRSLADMYQDKNFQRKFLVLADKRT